MATPEDKCQMHHDDVDPESRLVDMIVTQIRSHGYFTAHLAHLSEQDVVDLRWTAQFAGRALDRPVKTRVRRSSDQLSSTSTVVIAPTQARTADETALYKKAQENIEHLLSE
jgi:hypothetical protein